jgi:hypothetical protein
MVVGFDPPRLEECRRALVPVEAIAAADVKEACKMMSTVLPLVVLVDDALGDADRAQLAEMSTACGAEILVVRHGHDDISTNKFTSKLLDALRVAERRRLGLK